MRFAARPGIRCSQARWWALRQSVRPVMRHVGGAVSASVQRPAAKVSRAGVLSAQCDSFRFSGARDSGGFQPGPLRMNGTFWIVLAAHFVLISAFTFSNVSTGLARISPDIENVASSLGASPWYRLRYVTLPLMTPWMISALALSLSLSMGSWGHGDDLSAGLDDAPVTIFSLTDRGNIADGSALTIVLAG